MEVQKRDVTMGDILQMECTDKNVLAHLTTKKVWKVPQGKSHRCVISILKIVEWIHAEYPQADVQNFGAPDIIITYEEQRKMGKCLYGIKVAVIAVIVFVGAAYSIMSFHIDMDVTKLFDEIYGMVMGQAKKGTSVLELSYSIGLTLGILLFFNHFGKKRFAKDPTPLEVEMRTYEDEIQTTIIDTYSRKEQEIDVGKATTSGIHRN